jgi:hypothetical protein
MTSEAEGGDFILTSGQRWLLHLVHEAPDLARPVQRVYHLAKPFHPSSFLEALQYIVAIHPALRLQLVWTESGWRQCFPDQDAGFSAEEIVGKTIQMRLAYANMLIADQAKAALDLSKESPVKAKVIKIEDEYLLSLCVDHLAADEIAFDLLEQSLITFYQQSVSGGDLVAVINEDFLSYIAKEKATINAEKNNHLYWLAQLRNAPSDNSSENDITWTSASIFDHVISGRTFQSLLSFSRTHKCSLFNIVVAFQLLLMTDEEAGNDIILNIPVSNRAKAQERMIMANLSMLLHVRFTLIHNEPVPSLAVRVRNQILSAMAHRQYDYPSLIKSLSEKDSKDGDKQSWLKGCNFWVDVAPTVYPNALFAERMDNAADRIYDIPRTSFNLVARQTEDKLHISIEWDAQEWSMTRSQMEEKFFTTIKKFMA